MSGSKIAQMKNAIMSERAKKREAEEQISIWQGRLQRSKEKIRNLQRKIDAREHKSVSDHAIVRYL